MKVATRENKLLGFSHLNSVVMGNPIMLCSIRCCECMTPFTNKETVS
jgi:hypothetical protein